MNQISSFSRVFFSITWSLFAIVHAASATALDGPARATDSDKPNVMLSILGDAAWSDFGCYGSQIQTLNINRLANEGIRFTDCHAAAPLCSSSRAGMLTGRMPMRIGMYSYIPTNRSTHLRDEEITIAEILVEETWEEDLSSPSKRQRSKETIAALIEKGELMLEREVNGTGVHRVRRTRVMFQMNKPDHAALCRLFDISGKELSREELVEKLAEKATFLASFSGQMPHHQYLRLVDSDTLVLLIVPDDKMARPVAKVPRRHEDKAKTKNLDRKNRVNGDDYILALQRLPRIQLASAKEASDYMRGIWKMDENFLPRQREAEEGRIYVICTGDWLVIRRYMKRGGTVQDELHRIDGFEPNRAGRKHTQLKPETSGRHECNWEFWPIDQDHLHLRTYDTALPLQRMIQAKAEPLDSAKGRQTTEGSSRIAVSVLDEGHGGIYVHNADGSGKKRLTNGSSDILPRWSPDGKQIAFLTLREQDQELAAEHDLAFHWFLYVMDADGQNQRRVTKTPIGMIFQWSPDGTRFVFQSSCEDGANKAKDGTVSSAIYVMKSDGTEQKRLTPFKNNDGFPSWSPDGKQIAFCSNRNGNMDIFVMNADGSDVRRLTTNEANDSVPTWSPDGKQIAFTSFRESGTAFTVNADGTQESSLAVRGRPLAWSPDGHSLLIEKDGQLVLAGADGRNPKELTPEGQPALDGEFSPDGKAVYYRSKVNGTWTLMSVDTERSNQKRIWSDSGKFLGFSVSPSRVSLAKDSMSLPTANTHLTEFGNACRKSEKLYDDSRQQLFGLIPDFLDWKRREIEIPYSSTTNAFEARVIFTPPDGTKAHVAVLVSANRHLVQSKKVDVAEAEPIIVWGPSKVLTEAEYGRYDGHLLKQAAFVLEANLADKDSLDTYLESVDFKRIGKFVTRRIEQQGAPAGKPKSESDSARRETRTE